MISINKSISRIQKAMIGAAMVIASCSVMLVAQSADTSQFGTFSPTTTVEIDHSDWDIILKSYVSDAEQGRTIFAYGKVSEDDKSALKNYIGTLQALDPRTLTKEQAYAYWVNLYNAVTVDLILDNYPLESIRKLGLIGPWGRELITINGEAMSLNDVEHEVLRVFWRDPRTHYAVNCASFGCPNLQAVAFTSENTESLLEKGAVEYVNHPRGISVSNRGRVTASSIYKWYRKDFGETEADILDHVRKYANPALLEALEGKTRIRKYGYDWALNEE